MLSMFINSKSRFTVFSPLFFFFLRVINFVYWLACSWFVISLGFLYGLNRLLHTLVFYFPISQLSLFCQLFRFFSTFVRSFYFYFNYSIHLIIVHFKWSIVSRIVTPFSVVALFFFAFFTRAELSFPRHWHTQLFSN